MGVDVSSGSVRKQVNRVQESDLNWKYVEFLLRSQLAKGVQIISFFSFGGGGEGAVRWGQK